MKPTPKKPKIIIAQVEVSGTDDIPPGPVTAPVAPVATTRTSAAKIWPNELFTKSAVEKVCAPVGVIEKSIGPGFEPGAPFWPVISTPFENTPHGVSCVPPGTVNGALG